MKAIKSKPFILVSLLFCLLFIKPVLAKAQTDYIDNGISWLLNSQNVDGSWSDEPRIFLDTYTVLETLLFIDVYNGQISAGIDWVKEQEADNIDDLAHQILILSLAGEDVSGLGVS